jgi:AraC-like DNA-binding protein
MRAPTVKEQVGVHAPSPAPREVAEFICLRSASSNIRPRMHMRMAIVGIRSGTTIRVESKRTVVVEQECLLIVPPLHLYGVQSLRPTEHIATTVLVEMPELDGAAIDKLPALVDVPNLHEAWLAFVGDAERTVPSVERARAVRSLIEQWVTESTPIPPAHATGWAVPLRPLRDYMRAHMNEAIPTTMLAEISGLTASHCIRAFGQQFGLPPHAYHVQVRLASAFESLLQGGRVATVAHDCGFSDQSHLSRKFREAYDIAPAAWAALVHKTVVNTNSAGRIDVQPRACNEVGRQAVPA